MAVISEYRLMASCVAGAALLASAFCGVAAAAPEAGASIVRPMSELKVSATIPLAKVADWVEITPTSVWVASKGPYAVHEIDPRTNQVVTVQLPGDPCGGLAADAESLWVPICGADPKLAKVDLTTRTLAAVYDVGPGAKEGGIAIGAGSVWLMVDAQGALARIDPATGAVIATVQLPPGSYNPVFSEGRVWVSRADGAELTVIDADTAKVVDHVPTGPNPRFLTAGAGAVWTLNQGDGSLTRVDVAGRRAVQAVQLETPGSGGDIAYADGLVWSTVMKTPLTAVDADRAVLLCQWKGAGGDALAVGHGAIWLTDLLAGRVLRIELSDIPKECRPARGAP